MTGNATSMLTVDSDPNNSIWSNIWAMLTKPHKVTTESNKTFPGKVIRLNSSEFAWRFKWKEVATPTPKYPIILQNGVAANVSRDLNPIQLSTKTTRHTISLNSTVDTLGLWTRNSTNETVDYSWEGPDLTDNHTATNYTLPFPPKFTPIAGSPINNETSDNETGSVRAIYQHFSNNSQPHGTFNSTNKSANRTHLNTTDQLINVNETISDLEEYQNETILNILNVTNKMAHFYQQMNTSMRFDNVTLMVNTSAANSTIELIGLLESQWNETLVETKSTTRNSPKTTKQTSKRPKFAVVTGATSKEESNFLKQLKQFQSAVDSALLKD